MLARSMRVVAGRRLAILPVAAMLPIAAIASPLPGADPREQSPRTTTIAVPIAARGLYRLVLSVSTSAARDRVDLRVGPAWLPGIRVSAHGRARVEVVAELTPGAVEVRAVGRAARPRVRLRLNAAGAGVAPDGTMSVSRTVSSSPGAGRARQGSAPYDARVWSDEFNGPSGAVPDPSRWVADRGAYGYTDGQLQTDTTPPVNAALDGAGHLVITARRRTATGPDGRTRAYTSAQIGTGGRFSLTYGRVEARLQIPAGAGLLTQLWMIGDDVTRVGWPRSGEIDVIEAIGQDVRRAFGTIHGPWATRRDGFAVRRTALTRSPLSAGFHTYGVSWSPRLVTWTVDGTAYGSATPSDLPAGAGWPLDGHPFHLVLDLAVGGASAGPPDPRTPRVAALRVDWIRVYQ